MPRKPMPIRELFLNTGERSAGSAVPIWACRRCGWKLVDNATRFARHVLRCPSTQPGDRELAQEHLATLGGTSTAQLEAISATADEFGRAFTLEGKAHVRSLFEDTNASRTGEKAKLFRCKRCGHETTENATRFAQHILKCEHAEEGDRAIALEHQHLTAKRREMRLAKQSNRDAVPQAGVAEEPAARKKSAPKPRTGQDHSGESPASRRRSSSRRHSPSDPSRDDTASQDPSSTRADANGARSASHSGASPSEACDVWAESSDQRQWHAAEEPTQLGLDTHPAASGAVAESAHPRIHRAMPSTEAAHDITDLDELDCFVDEGFEEELARLAPHSGQPVTIEHIPAGAECSANRASACLAMAVEALPNNHQGSRDVAEPSHMPHVNGAVRQPFSHQTAESYEEIVDLLPSLDMVTMSRAAEPEPFQEDLMPVTFQKRQRDNSGASIKAETVSISMDEYQQWKQWKEQLAMPKIIQVPDMEYSMFQNLYSFFIGHAMSCANTYFSHGGSRGPSCSSAMIGEAIREDWTRLAAVYKTMATCCAKAQARYVLEKASTCPDRIAGIYDSIIVLAQDCLDTGIGSTLHKWSMIPRLDSSQQALYKGLDKAFQHMTLDDNGTRHAPDPKAEGTILNLQHFTCTYGPYLRDLYLNNSKSLTGCSSSFAEQVQQPHFGSSSAMVSATRNTSENALDISEGDFSSWHKSVSDFTPIMDEIASDMRTSLAVTAYMTQLYSVAGWDLVLII